MTHPIVLPPHIEIKLIDEASRFRDGGAARERWLIQRAAQLGADQELEACCQALYRRYDIPSCTTPKVAEEMRDWLRAARRPKPPSLKQQALDALEEENDALPLRSLQRGERFALIRRALESIPDPQD